MASKYLIVNASNDVFVGAVAKGDGLVQPSTRRVLELEDELSDAKIANWASSNVFIKKSGAAADNEKPLPGMDSAIALARNTLMLAAGQERQDIIDSLLKGEEAQTKTSKASSSATTAAPSTTPAAQGATAGAAAAPTAGNTSTAGS